jgi:hypothetical protein
VTRKRGRTRDGFLVTIQKKSTDPRRKSSENPQIELSRDFERPPLGLCGTLNNGS